MGIKSSVSHQHTKSDEWVNPKRGAEPPLPPAKDTPRARKAAYLWLLWSARGASLNQHADPERMGIVLWTKLCKGRGDKADWNAPDLIDLAREAVIVAAEEARIQLEKQRAIVARRTNARLAETRALAAEKAALIERRDRIQKILGVKRSRAYDILNNGTALPEQAQRLAEAFEGTAPAYWMAPDIGRPGRRPPAIVPTIQAAHLAGCSMQDFIRAVPEDDRLRYACDAFRWLDERYLTRGPIAEHFTSFAELQKEIPVGTSHDQVICLWNRYREWRTRLIVEAMENDLFEEAS